METRKSTETRSVTAGSERMSITTKETVRVDKSGFTSKITDIKQKLSELQSGNFLEQVKLIEFQASYYSAHSAALEERLVLMGVETERLNVVMRALEDESKLLVAQNETLKFDLGAEASNWKTRCGEKEAALARLTVDANDAAKRAAREKTDLLGKVAEKEALEQELGTKNRALGEELRALRLSLVKAEDASAAHERRIVQMEATFNQQLASLKKEHEEGLERLEAAHRTQLEAAKREASETRAREVEREKSRAADELKLNVGQREARITTLEEEALRARTAASRLESEVERLNSALGALKGAADEKERQALMREDDFAARAADLERVHAEQRDAQVAQLTAEWRGKLDSLASRHDVELKGLRKKLIDAENQVGFLTKEKALVERNAADLRVENERLKSDAAQLREEYEAEFEEMTKQIETFRTTYIDPKELEVRFRAERSSYETQISQLNSKVVELSGQIVFLSEDNKRLNAQALDRLRDIEMFKQKLSSAGDASEAEELARKVSGLRAELDEALERLLKLSNEKNTLNARVKSLEGEVELVRGDLTDTRGFLQQKRDEVRTMEDAAAKLRKTNADLAAEKNRLAGDFMTMKEKNDTFMANYNSLVSERDHFKSAYERVDVEHSSANKELLAKIGELDELKSKYYEALNNFQREAVTTTTTITKKVSNIASSRTGEKKEDFSNLQ